MAYNFGDKVVSDALLSAVKGVTSGKQTVTTDGKEAELKVGDSVAVREGAHKGMTGTITGFKTTGRSEVQLNRGSRIDIYNSELSRDNTQPLNENLDNFGKKKAKKWPNDKDGDGKVDEDKDEDKDEKKGKGKEKVTINPDLGEEKTDDRTLADLIKSVVRDHRRKQFEALEVGDQKSVDKIKDITPGEAPGPADDLGYDKSAGVGVVSDDDLEKMLAQGRKL